MINCFCINGICNQKCLDLAISSPFTVREVQLSKHYQNKFLEYIHHNYACKYRNNEYKLFSTPFNIILHSVAHTL